MLSHVRRLQDESLEQLIDVHTKNDHASYDRKIHMPRARALMHMLCTDAQHAIAHISAILSLNGRYSSRTSPHSGQSFASLRGALPAPGGSGSHAKP